MNKLVIGLMILFVIAGLLLFNLKIFQKTGEMTNEKKAQTCPEGKKKYYSEYENGLCGESCHDSKSVFVAKLVNRKMKFNLANGKTCESLGYKNYVGTQSNGVFSQITYVDIYSKD